MRSQFFVFSLYLELCKYYLSLVFVFECVFVWNNLHNRGRCRAVVRASNSTTALFMNEVTTIYIIQLIKFWRGTRTYSDKAACLFSMCLKIQIVLIWMNRYIEKIYNIKVWCWNVVVYQFIIALQFVELVEINNNLMKV